MDPGYRIDPLFRVLLDFRRSRRRESAQDQGHDYRGTDPRVMGETGPESVYPARDED